MDCAIVIDDGGALTVAPYDVQAGDCVVVGQRGVQASRAAARAAQGGLRVHVERGLEREAQGTRCSASWRANCSRSCASGKRVLLVGGPAIMHTGAGPYLDALIRDGFVNALFAGNALAVHDIESQFFGTSLGVDLEDAFPAEEGHVHHLRAINRIRAAGGIRSAIDSRHAARRHHVRSVSRRTSRSCSCGSIRDDGPLPEVITDVIECAARDAPATSPRSAWR